MPERIQFAYGHSTSYLYDASGVKRQVAHDVAKNNLNIPMGTTENTLAYQDMLYMLTTDYFGNKVYENGELKYILNPDGYILCGEDVNRQRTYDFHYYLKDHLGNIRKVLSPEGGALEAIYKPEQENNYYASGLLQPNSFGSEVQPYKFGGKELDEVAGLNWYDFHARQRDAIIPMFTTMDPMAEKYYNISPYAYCNNNPVNYTDLDGRDIILFNVTHRNSSGNPRGTKGQVSSTTNASLTDQMNTKEGRAFFAQFAKAGDVVGGYTFTEDGKYSSTNLFVYDYSWEKETGNIIPSGTDGSISISEDKVTLKLSSYGKNKNEIGEIVTHETQLHGNKAGDMIEERTTAPTTIEDHKALKYKDTKHKGYSNYNSVRQQLEKIDENYKKAFKEAEEHARRNY